MKINAGEKILEDALYKSDREYNMAKQNAEKYFKEAVDYFMKAKEINPDESIYKRNLRALYYRLGMSEDLEAIEKEMGY